MAELNANGAPMTFELVAADDGAPIIKVAGELDITSIDELEEGVQPILDRAPDVLVIDASSLRFADSSAIALWVKWSMMVRRLEVRNPPELLRRVIDSMGLDEALGVTP